MKKNKFKFFKYIMIELDLQPVVTTQNYMYLIGVSLVVKVHVLNYGMSV